MHVREHSLLTRAACLLTVADTLQTEPNDGVNACTGGSVAILLVRESELRWWQIKHNLFMVCNGDYRPRGMRTPLVLRAAIDCAGPSRARAPRHRPSCRPVPRAAVSRCADVSRAGGVPYPPHYSGIRDCGTMEGNMRDRRQCRQMTTAQGTAVRDRYNSARQGRWRARRTAAARGMAA